MVYAQDRVQVTREVVATNLQARALSPAPVERFTLPQRLRRARKRFWMDRGTQLARLSREDVSDVIVIYKLCGIVHVELRTPPPIHTLTRGHEATPHYQVWAS